MGLNVVFSVLFSTWFARAGWLPHGGLALANSLATAIEAAGLIYFMRHKVGGMGGGYILRGSLQAGVATAAMSLAIWFWLERTAGMPSWMVALGGVATGGAVYGVAVWGMKVREARALIRILLRFLRRLPGQKALPR
jgi:putative peptidoglycan lipid II flippase